MTKICNTRQVAKLIGVSETHVPAINPMDCSGPMTDQLHYGILRTGKEATL